MDECKGKNVLVYLKNDKKNYSGKLLAFDIHTNIVLDDCKLFVDGKEKTKLGLNFIRGDVVESVSPSN